MNTPPPSLIESMRLANLAAARIRAMAAGPTDEGWIAVARLAEALSRTARGQIAGPCKMPRQSRYRWVMPTEGPTN